MRESDVNWKKIFERRPDLTPPGYDSVVAGLTDPEYVENKKRVALEAAQRKKDKNKKGKSSR